VLPIWEAQFGDFANGAQTVIDQYISSAEMKWGKMSGLVMLLPHGYEGQGPEHSNARPERFLQLCADNNMVVTNITTAANFFHAIRRQLAWQFRKPLVNFSPKAHLRLPKTYSSVEEFTTGGFSELIDDAGIQDTKAVKRVLLCTGKVYFDLLEKQQNDKRLDVAIVRLEQLHPLPTDQLAEMKKKYGKAEWIWVQEEPRNMGSWGFLSQNLEMPMKCVSRKAAASPATGYGKLHAKEQAEILGSAFG
jgi:2-oxoglutarate dehydrogenase E1 component